ncbi:hypothetical protein TSH58p_22540 (plasmid) [Azospirillum sp. TSH58]|uniref:KilA-N domain-containing protein n=1 Tax=Azospirillum sp. TSH58 TaxID=664962 RepID=UPI000D60122B|nr:KilA-N domain-containing protein [Azospirillum sp. TSH58]AWJ86302.1 hypothetical protein TSH58p_22540 [Azospirillum sp. TSH58]
MTNITRTFNGTPIGQRDDGYLNATAMCKANGKEWSGYERNVGTEEFIRELSLSLQICRDSLIVSKPGRPDRGGRLGPPKFRCRGVYRHGGGKSRFGVPPWNAANAWVDAERVNPSESRG